MKITFNHTDFYYGETIYKRLEALSKRRVIVFSDLIIYENFQAKLETMLEADWLIVPKGFEAFETIKELASFIARKNVADLLIIGQPDLLDLGLFVAGNTKIENCYLFPTGFDDLPRFIKGESTIFSENALILQNKITPAWLDFDFHFFEASNQDLLSLFVRLIEIYYFDLKSDLNELFFEFRTRDELTHRKLYTYVGKVAETEIFNHDFFYFKRLLLNAFKRIMAEKDIKMTAFLIHIYLLKKYFAVEFKLDNLLKWVSHLGFQLEIPEKLSLTRLIDQMMLAFNGKMNLFNPNTNQLETLEIGEIEVLNVLQEYKEWIKGAFDEQSKSN
ncbi:MAG: hypothetical protein LBS33_09025 [Streptococcaceae bacterium]|nr:hypothetical protein [Streptococcaceae bacterium]